MNRLHTYRATVDQAIVAIGNNTLREQLTQKLVAASFKLAVVIHPRAFVSPSAVVDSGSAVKAGAILGTEARLGLGSIVNCGGAGAPC